MTDTVVVIYVEGDTDYEFYKILVEHIRKQRGGRLHCRVRYRNLRGVCNYGKDASNFLQKKILPEFPDHTYKIALCYDTDVFERPERIPVSWQKVEKELYAAGAEEIIHVKAVQSIEDWFMYDKEGIRQYLRLPGKLNISQHIGTSGLKALFRLSGRKYEKCKKCYGLISALNMDVILPCIMKDIKGLLQILE